MSDIGSNTDRPFGSARVAMGLFFAAYCCVAALQAAHFHFYFNQDAMLSVRWALVDWAVWALLSAAMAYGMVRWASLRAAAAIALFVALAGPLHIILTSLAYGLALGWDESLMESFVSLMNKRWLQNIFIGGVLALALHQLLARFSPQAPDPAEAPPRADRPEEPLTLQDGAHTYFVRPDDILMLEASGNYVCVDTADRAITVRSSLKALTGKLPADAFVQVNRSMVVRRSAIARMEKYSKNSFQLFLTSGAQIKIGRTFLPALREFLKGRGAAPNGAVRPL